MIVAMTKGEFDAWIAQVRENLRRVKEAYPDVNVGVIVTDITDYGQFMARIETSADTDPFG